MGVCKNCEHYKVCLVHCSESVLRNRGICEHYRNGWISVYDRLPNKNEKVIVRGVRGGIQAGIFRGALAPGNEGTWYWKKNSFLDVPYWMPQDALPEPPKEE